MYSLGAPLDAAAVAAYRRLGTELTITWAVPGHGDLGVTAADWDLDRGFDTDAPDGTRFVEGAGAAVATVTLAGLTPSGVDVLCLLSGDRRDSPLYGTPRDGRPAILDVTVLTESGVYVLTRITGVTSTIRVDRGAGTATLVLLDRAATLRGLVTLPMVLADSTTDVVFAGFPTSETLRPGLNAQWVVDYALREAGVYATPPPRPGAVLVATMHGSAWPEIGQPTGQYWGAAREPLRFEAGRFALALSTPPVGSKCSYQLSRVLGVGAGEGFLVECWALLDQLDTTIMISVNDSAGGDHYAWCGSSGISGTLQFTYRRTTADPETVVTGPSTFSATGRVWRYCAWLVEYLTETSMRVTMRVGSTQTVQTVTIPTLVAATLDTATVGWTTESVQVTQEGGTVAPDPFNTSWVTQAQLSRSQLELTATPAVAGRQVWEVVKEVAAAEYASVWFSEPGVLVYRSRAAWRDPTISAPARVLTDQNALTQIVSEEDPDTVRNRVRVPASPFAVGARQIVWTAAQRYRVTTTQPLNLIMDLGGAVAGLDLSVTVLPSGGDPTISAYRAAVNADGTGGQVADLVIRVRQISPDTAVVDVTNPGTTSASAWLVSPSGAGFPSVSNGRPALQLSGRRVLAAEEQTEDGTTGPTLAWADAADTGSITERGERLLELEPSPWRQDLTSCQELAAELLLSLARPQRLWRDVAIAGDPRLQLGDRITVDEPILGASTDAVIIALGEQTTPDTGYVQRLTLRGVLRTYADAQADHGTYADAETAYSTYAAWERGQPDG